MMLRPGHGLKVARAAGAAILALLAACGGGGGNGAQSSTGAGVASVSPGAISFDATAVGTMAAAQSVQIRNSGTAPLAIEGVALSGPDSASFTLSSGCAATLPVDGSCTVKVAFAPTLAGTKSASLAVHSASATSVSVSLSGDATAALVAASQSAIGFGTTAVGTTSPVMPLTLTNSGTAPLSVSAIAITGADAEMFTIASGCASPVAPGASCAIGVAFAPTSAGTKEASLVVRSNAATEPSVSLSGLAALPGSPTFVLKALLANSAPIVPFHTVTTQLSGDISAAATGIAVTSVTGFPSSGHFIALLSDDQDVEYVLVTAGAGTPNWTVIRAYNGSSAAAFPAAGTTVTYIPLATQKGATINGAPITAIAATFTASVGGQLSGTLVSAIENGLYALTFADGEVRNVAVQNGTSVSWSPALAARVIMTATSAPKLAPAGVASRDPLSILTQRFDLTAPVYLAQHQRLSNRGAILTADLPSSGATTISVDSTANFQQSGNFMLSTGSEDLLVNVANAATLNIVARAQDGTSAAALTGAASTFYQLFEVDFGGGGGTQAFYVAGSLNSGLSYLGVASTVGALKEYEPEQPLSMHFVLDGSYFEVLANGNVSMFAIADGVVQQSANYAVETPYGGAYWHKFDFGSRKTRNVTLFASAYPMSIATAPTDTIEPWDRSKDPFISWDGDPSARRKATAGRALPTAAGWVFTSR